MNNCPSTSTSGWEKTVKQPPLARWIFLLGKTDFASIGKTSSTSEYPGALNQSMSSKHIDDGMSAFTRQVGEEKYSSPWRNFAIQPAKFIAVNKLGWYEGNAVKYVCRHKFKNGPEDVRKAIHYLEMLLEDVYGATK